MIMIVTVRVRILLIITTIVIYTKVRVRDVRLRPLAQVHEVPLGGTTCPTLLVSYDLISFMRCL